VVGCDFVQTGDHPGSCRHAQAFFNTQEDFLFSEILHQGHLSRDLSEKLIKLVNLCLSGNGVFTINRYAEIEAAWEAERASSRLTSVKSGRSGATSC
jgi:hypothetical protein